MKHFDLDWAGLLNALAGWEALDLGARRQLLDTLRPSGAVASGTLGRHLAALHESGLVEATPGRAMVVEEMRPVVRALRAMDRHRLLFQESSETALHLYLEDHYTSAALRALTSDRRFAPSLGWADRYEVGRQIRSVGWIEDFLSLDTPADVRAWEEAHCSHQELALVTDADTLSALRRLLGELMAREQGIPLAELREMMRGVSEASLGMAIQATLRYLFCFAILDPQELEPRIGLWPAVVRRLSEPPPQPPAPVEPTATFHAALMMQDMTAVLVAAFAEPIRVRGHDFEIFARQEAAIARRLVAMPAWMRQWSDIDPGSRVAVAATMLQRFELARTAGVAGRDLRIEPTSAGKRWLALGERDRLAELLERIRSSPERNPQAYGYGGSISFFAGHFSLALADQYYDLRSALEAAFLALPRDAFVPVDEFLRFHTQARNPLVVVRQRLSAAPAGRFGRVMRREDCETAWHQVLDGFLIARLAMLGGARLGQDAQGRVCFCLAGPGRFLLGEIDEFAYGQDLDARVVVQPNFEIVFLAPSPTAEARVGRLAERVGNGPGVMFRLTRASLLTAAETGASAEEIIGTLREVSARELPANVETQLRDWLGAVRRISVREALLIRCPDPATAGRVRAAAGVDARPITDTLLELTAPSPQKRNAMLKKLRKEGVFVG